jgi:hypothetical protein
MRFLTLGLTALSLAAFTFSGSGCDSQTDDHAGHDHDHADHDHDHADHADHADHGPTMDDHGHGPTVELGSATIGDFQVRASRDGDVAAGGELPVDVWIDGAPPVDAVRFWVGVESAAGSIKAKAGLEGDHWHTHVAVPAVIPDGASLWIEIQSGDARTAGSVSLDGAG